MPNIASVLKDEIARVARKELRRETEKLKKSSALYRSNIAELKRQVSALEKLVSQHVKAATKNAVGSETPSTSSKVRFSAKSLISQRKRLSLSAAGLSKLIGVTPQSIYNWESGVTRPRQEQVVVISALRTLSKRQAHARLEELC